MSQLKLRFRTINHDEKQPDQIDCMIRFNDFVIINTHTHIYVYILLQPLSNHYIIIVLIYETNLQHKLSYL